MTNRYAALQQRAADIDILDQQNPETRTSAMHVLIDTTHHRVLARHASYLALAALHYIQFANVDAVIFGEGTNRPWAQFDANALLDILQTCGGRPLGPHSYPYNDLVTFVRNEVERANWLICPFPAETLVMQANALAPSDAKPAKFNPEGTLPTACKEWTCEPKKPGKRPRSESSYATNFLNGDASLPTSAPRAPVAPDAPRPRKQRSVAPKASSAPKEPRAPRVQRAPGSAPAAGSKTGAVWTIADAALVACKGKIGDWKAFRAGVIALCDKEGINKSTASVQYGKWKASKGL